MMRKTFFPLAVFLVLSAGVCWGKTRGSGHVVTENRNVSGVQSVELTGIGDLTIVQGDAEGLSVDAEDNVMPLVETTVTKGQLHIGIKNNEVTPTKPVLLKLTVKSLNKINLAGSGDVNSEKLISSAPMDIRQTGSGDLDIAGLDCPSLTVTASGSGDTDLAGKTKELAVDASGSGDCTAIGLQAENAKVNVKGSGTCSVWASGKLDASVYGSGSVGYRGTPAVTKQVKGSGTVHALAEKSKAADDE